MNKGKGKTVLEKGAMCEGAPPTMFHVLKKLLRPNASAINAKCLSKSNIITSLQMQMTTSKKNEKHTM